MSDLKTPPFDLTNVEKVIYKSALNFFLQNGFDAVAAEEEAYRKILSTRKLRERRDIIRK